MATAATRDLADAATDRITVTRILHPFSAAPVLLLLQPIADWSLARYLGASRTSCRWVFVGGVFASMLLFIPALGLFME